MGALLNILGGTALKSLAGYEQAKSEQKKQHEQISTQFMTNALMKDPVAAAEFGKTPEGQKAFASVFGKEHADAAIQWTGFMAQHQQQQQAQFAADMGGGAPQDGKVNFGGSPSAGSQPQPSDQLAQLRQHRDNLIAHMNGLGADNPYLPRYQQAIKQLDTEIAQAQREMYDSPEAKAKATTATTQARIDTETNPANVKAQSAAEASKATAATNARIGAETSPTNTAAEAALAKAKKEAESSVPPAPKPWGPKERADAWDKAASDAEKVLTTSGGFLRGTGKPKPADVLRYARSLLRKEGINPKTLDRYKPGEVILDDTGKPIMGKSGKPVTWVE